MVINQVKEIKHVSYSDQNHPECRPDEIFLTNSTLGNFKLIEHATKRMGKTAYDVNGNPLNQATQSSLFPVFVSRAAFEAYKKEMEDGGFAGRFSR